MSSSGEEAIAVLNAWVDANAKIRASFSSSGVILTVEGRLRFLDGTLTMIDEAGKKVALSIPLGMMVARESFEPLLDAPEEVRFKMDFFRALAFRVPCGDIDFFELAE